MLIGTTAFKIEPNGSTVIALPLGLLDIGPLKCRNLFHRNIPGRVLCPKNVALWSHFRIGIQESTRHNPKFLTPAQLRQSGSTVPTEATGESRIVLGVNETPNQIITTCP